MVAATTGPSASVPAYDPARPIRVLVIRALDDLERKGQIGDRDPETGYVTGAAHAHLTEIAAGDFDALRELVGGHLQAVALHRVTEGPHEGMPAAVLWCDEEGKFAGAGRNLFATALAAGMDAGLAYGDIVCGTAVVTGNGRAYDEMGRLDPEEGEVCTDVTEEVLAKAREIAERIKVPVDLG